MPRRIPESQTTICPACANLIVRAQLADGSHVALDVSARAYYLRLQADNVHYRAEKSGAYPVHLCRGQETTP